MATLETFQAGKLFVRLDNGPGTATTFNPDGTVQSTRPLTGAETARLAAEDAAATVTTNQATLQARAQAALAANAAFLGLGSPTNAQTLAQVQTLTRECTALIRLALSLLDSTAGT